MCGSLDVTHAIPSRFALLAVTFRFEAIFRRAKNSRLNRLYSQLQWQAFRAVVISKHKWDTKKLSCGLNLRFANRLIRVIEVVEKMRI
ncbi:unnamed protein product [Lasius platythorax]|uniref:Uncharacterized protein n=1 Tax=Lasius platythorax TaxID=488582 RepID=A0AAV2NVE1_9HYME